MNRESPGKCLKTTDTLGTGLLAAVAAFLMPRRELQPRAAARALGEPRASADHKLHHEVAAARKPNDVNRIAVAARRPMMLTDALRERIEAMGGARR